MVEQFEDLLVRILLLAACISFVSMTLVLSAVQMVFSVLNGPDGAQRVKTNA